MIHRESHARNRRTLITRNKEETNHFHFALEIIQVFFLTRFPFLLLRSLTADDAVLMCRRLFIAIILNKAHVVVNGLTIRTELQFPAVNWCKVERPGSLPK